MEAARERFYKSIPKELSEEDKLALEELARSSPEKFKEALEDANGWFSDQSFNLKDDKFDYSNITNRDMYRFVVGYARFRGWI